MTWEEFIDTPLANLADQIMALSGDNVPPLDDTQRLLSALRRAGFLDKHETMRLQALYLNRKPETWQQMAERLGVEVTEIGNVTFRKGRVPNVALGVSCYLTLQGSSAPRIDTMSNIHLNQPDAPRKARDLSACLQVAARYLEEVEQ